ncbi:MAG: tRNA 2-thiouridine(34) synthase MnmA, partial [Oscillospiraceae bacterium]|nr:tRNA 2-thiouridine(34) synthase MnmA [Oscillospiraceae bacterium]
MKKTLKNRNNMKKILIAMSGGVDSSVAALLLKEERLDCAGAMMRLFSAGGGTETGRLEYPDDQDARAVASSLGVPFYVLDFADAFARRVIGRFVSAYQGGATPNPCVDCNRYIKFGRFLDASREMGYDHIATGHYARIERRNGR